MFEDIKENEAIKRYEDCSCYSKIFLLKEWIIDRNFALALQAGHGQHRRFFTVRLNLVINEV